MVLFIAAILPLLALLATASPHPSRDNSLQLRQDDSDDPQFPASPASCGECEENYDSIKLCISVAPVMANFSTVIANPGSFISVITCACTEPFKSTFPQCVDCFENTGQEAVLNMSDPDDVIAGINKVCALESAVFGIGSSSSSSDTDTDATATATGTLTTTSAASTATSLNAAAINTGPLSGLLFGAMIFMLGSTW
ncbi:hypothetical protein DFH07DRAFT_849206 [Mycena maculata]|uniref:Uncharacterized protein n=1 Tax=Mycena maculata TaxID=230809 RepID=A0AAD7MRS4_9AGAR|nr:hypothetical protein DFH07DRAFT_849206 [Mycena maculata]